MTDTITLPRAEAKELLRALRVFDAGAMIKAEKMLIYALAQQADCTTTGVCVKSGLYCPPARPVREPSCDTCKHCTVASQDSFEETCFVCSNYYNNKYEAKK